MGNPTPLYDILFQCEHTGANQEIVASPAGMIIMIIMCRHFLCVPLCTLTQFPNSIILSGSKPALLCQFLSLFFLRNQYDLNHLYIEIQCFKKKVQLSSYNNDTQFDYFNTAIEPTDEIILHQQDVFDQAN